MKKNRESLFWVGVLAEYMIAFSVLAFILSLPLGGTGFWSGYLGWAIVLPLVISEMDDETRNAIKRWATRSKVSERKETHADAQSSEQIEE